MKYKGNYFYMHAYKILFFFNYLLNVSISSLAKLHGFSLTEYCHNRLVQESVTCKTQTVLPLKSTSVRAQSKTSYFVTNFPSFPHCHISLIPLIVCNLRIYGANFFYYYIYFFYDVLKIQLDIIVEKDHFLSKIYS